MGSAALGPCIDPSLCWAVAGARPFFRLSPRAWRTASGQSPKDGLSRLTQSESSFLSFFPDASCHLSSSPFLSLSSSFSLLLLPCSPHLSAMCFTKGAYAGLRQPPCSGAFSSPGPSHSQRAPCGFRGPRTPGLCSVGSLLSWILALLVATWQLLFPPYINPVELTLPCPPLCGPLEVSMALSR